MLLGIAFLVIGILGFTKKRINVSSKRELRGRGLYTVSTLFCIPLLGSLLIGAVVSLAGDGMPSSVILPLALLIFWGPVIAGLVLAFVLAEPKETAPQDARGFDVTSTTPPPPPQVPDRGS